MKRQTDEYVISEGCNCNAGFESGIVLDPFAGAGTTLLSAFKQGKRAFVNITRKLVTITVRRRKEICGIH